MATYSGSAGSPITFKVSSPKTWSPDSPNLYDFTIDFGKDTVGSYTGFRTVTRKEVNGVQRVLLVSSTLCLSPTCWFLTIRRTAK